MDFIVISSFFYAVLRVSSPLILASLGGALSERSGIIHIGLEGVMLVGAFVSASVTALTHDPLLGLFAGMMAGVLMNAFYALFVIEFKSDQIIAGTALNLLAFGLIPLVSKVLFNSTGGTPSLEMNERLGTGYLSIAFVSVVLVSLLFKRTRLGLRISFAGEHPEGLQSAGVSLRLTRWKAQILSGAFTALGGSLLSICLSSSYSKNMTAGRGFIALTALIFGKWRPFPAMLACLFFGFCEVIQIHLQGAKLFGLEIPLQFIQILPYVATLLVLAGFVGKSSAPKALGRILSLLILLPLISGCTPQLQTSKAKKQAVEQTKLQSPQAQLSQIHSEWTSELIRVFMNSDQVSHPLFRQLRDTLNQGASVEGVVSTLMASQEYLDAIKANSAHSSHLFWGVFSKELSHVHETCSFVPLKEELEITSISFPDGTDKISALPPRFIGLNDWLQIAQSKPVFILKKVLAKYQMECFSKLSKEKKIEFFKKFLQSTLNLEIDLGLKERNSKDLNFHLNWMNQVDSEVLSLELIVRTQRILNHYLKENS